MNFYQPAHGYYPYVPAMIPQLHHQVQYQQMNCQYPMFDKNNIMTTSVNNYSNNNYTSTASSVISTENNDIDDNNNNNDDLLLLLFLADLAALLKTINVKQMKNAKLNQKATAPATNFPHSFLF